MAHLTCRCLSYASRFVPGQYVLRKQSHFRVLSSAILRHTSRRWTPCPGDELLHASNFQSHRSKRHQWVQCRYLCSEHGKKIDENEAEKSDDSHDERVRNLTSFFFLFVALHPLLCQNRTKKNMRDFSEIAEMHLS